ncbi:bacteriocin-like protein [Chryseobacterium sp. JUb7]|uniref:bacteriocin-like protein n=1 Tax=Chryseobacterium sp. JUb7 TaxID=2940599 RepID=UPI00216A060B|nr:hypothetical protein [Chryseobacterium sp. JUb7]MCS3528923.1 hypothetical protein [Chryseobacterium sp. JUb7]
MKNLKKLNRNELKSIEGNGLLGDLGAGLGVLIGGIGATVGGIIVGTFQTAEGLMCKINCTVNGVVDIKILKCDNAAC